MSALRARIHTTQCLLVRAISPRSRNGSLIPVGRVRSCVPPTGAPAVRLRGPNCRPLSTAKAQKPTAAAPSSTPASPPRGSTPADRKFVYPERLVIYHAGTGRTVFLGWVKIATIFTFVFFGLVVAPRYLSADEPLWAVAYFVGGLVPFAFVAYTTSPFVSFVNIYLPPFARGSREMLQRFAKAPPPTARLDVSTLSLIGKPRVSETTVGALHPTRRRFGLVNYERDAAAEDARRRWWQFRAVGAFNVQPGREGRLKTGWVWKEVADSIARRAKP